MNKEKGYGYLLVANILIKKGFDIVKQDNNIFRFKTKQAFNNLMDLLVPQMLQVERIRNLVFNKEEIRKMQIEQEDVEIELDEVKEVFSNFINIYFDLTPTELYDFNLLLTNVKNKKKLYTEEEVKNLLEDESKRKN